MKRKWMIPSLWILSLLPLFSQQEQPAEPDQPLQEYVSVTNVELVLRVIQDGRTLGGFKKEDFRLLENGRERRINGFFELKKKMIPEEKEAAAVAAPGRLFLLLFWASQEQTEIKSHLDRFFSDIYRPNDRVVLTGSQVQVDVRSPEQVSSAIEEFEKRLRTEISQKHDLWKGLHRDITHEIDRMLENIRLNRDAAEVKSHLGAFSEKYARLMKEVETMTRGIDFKQMEKMSESLQKVHASKWALLFFEPQRIPMVNITDLKSEVEKAIICDDDGTMIGDWFKGLVDIEMNMSKMGSQYSLFEKLRSRFIQADTIFHFLMMDTPSSARMGAAEENELISFKPLSSSWETIMKSISLTTGGQVADIQADPSALTPLFEQEDISYLITYVPETSKTVDRRIELLLAKPRPGLDNHHLVYGKRIELEKTPSVQIDRISHFQNTLFVTCSRYYPIYTPKGTRGHLHVRVEGRLGREEPLELFNGDVECEDHIEIPLSIDRSGSWELALEVTDHMTQLQSDKAYTLPYFVQVDQAQDPSALSSEMTTMLRRSAFYCEKLKKAALKFFCSETVTEKIGTIIKTNRRKKWIYDYQIVLQDGKLSETRSEEKRSDKKKKTELKTLYRSYYSFFLPVTFMSKERQDEYRYSFIDKDRMQKRTALHITAMPKNPALGLPGGELWIDEEDGSVLQIKLDPTTLIGFKNRYKLAEQKDKLLTITDTHQYFTRFNGMRFPTSTFISEQQALKFLPGNIRLTSQYHHIAERFEPTLYSVHFEYTDFRFFDINTDERITGWVEE